MDGLTIRDVLLFTAGAVIGSLVTKYLIEDRCEKEKEEAIEAYRERHDEKERRLEKKEEIRQKRIYHSLASSYSSKPDPVENEHLEDDEELLYEVISLDEYADGMPHYDKVSITYYEGDGTLVDEREEQIDDIERTIGPDALDNFGNGSDDPDIVYVRNYKMATDFEVVRVEESFGEISM